ncbi:MAG: cytochrome c [Saprospiraceae bacterium]|jgi:cytochrome c6|nr:cytochrome c [Saprospiraceae bacterium]
MFKQSLIFSLLVLAALSCGSKENKSAPVTVEKAKPAKDGAKIFKQSCELCHGPDGKLGANGSKDLSASELDLDARIAMVTKGKGLMTPFENILSLEEIKAVAEYSMTLNATK